MQGQLGMLDFRIPDCLEVDVYSRDLVGRPRATCPADALKHSQVWTVDAPFPNATALDSPNRCECKPTPDEDTEEQDALLLPHVSRAVGG